MPSHIYLKEKEVATSIASEATTASRSPTTVHKTAVSTSRTAGVRVVCFASALFGGIFLSPALLVSVLTHLLPGATVPAACQALGRAPGLIPLARSTLALGPAL